MNEIRKIAQKLKNLHFHVSNNLREERLLTTIIHLCNKADFCGEFQPCRNASNGLTMVARRAGR